MKPTARPDPIPPLRARKQEFVRGTIWDSAVDLFVERGYDATTVDDIARAAGVSRRSFFRYFASKDDLMGHGIVTYAAFITGAIRACPRDASPLEVVRLTVRQVATGAAAHPRVRRIAHVASTSVAARQAQLARKADLEDAVAEAYGSRFKAAAIDELRPRLLAELTISLLDVTFRVWLKQDQQDIVPTTDRVFGELTRLVCDATYERSSGGAGDLRRYSRARGSGSKR
jgi:AcrR family transcriptional regulator